MATYPELKDKSVLITGASRGIGLAIADRFINEGARVFLTDIDEGQSAGIISMATKLKTTAVFQKLNVMDRGQVETSIAAVVREFGRLDVMVCNAGIADPAPLIEATEESYEKQMAVNAKGCFLCATAAARQMIKQGGGGRIIINASGAGKVAPGLGQNLGVYAISKHAVVGLTRSLGSELAGENILVNCVCAGVVDTPMWDLIDKMVTTRSGTSQGSFKTDLVKKIPLGRIQQPSDVANSVVYLASNEANYMAGQTLDCSGGLMPC